MSIHFKRLALRSLVVAAALGSVSAYAADPKQIADAIVAAAEAGGNGQTKLTYTDATANGDDVVISGVSVSGDGDTASVPSIVITGAVPRDKGGFTAAKMVLDNGTMTSDGQNVTWQTASVENVTIPSPDEIKAKARVAPFTSVAIGGLNVQGGDMPAPLDIAQIAVSLQSEEDGTPRDVTTQINGIAVTSAFFGDGQAKAVLGALGYDKFLINVVADGAYEHTSDTLTVRGFTIDAVDVGKLAIEGKFLGVALSKLANSSTAKDVQSSGKLDHLTIRFDNSGIVQRVIAMQAQAAGVKPEDFVAQISMALPLMLNAIGNQPLQDKIAAAAAAFLKDPKSITVSASPAEPVPFTTIMSTAQTAPNTLPDVLVVDITAND
jgi:hypothetical protein